MLKVTVSSAQLKLEKKAVRKALRRIGGELVKEARGLVNRAGSPSKPGEPPSKRTGSLARSIRFRARGLRGSLSAGEHYSRFLETGAQGGGRRGVRNNKRALKHLQTRRTMEPRPFISRVVERNRASIQRRLGEALAQGIDFRMTKR